MGERPEISVIVPCYNAERYLSLCLSSLAAQHAPDIEMILIDDGSTDATGAILDRFAETEARAIVVHVANEGVSAARNRGIDRARGRYIAFMDADDALEEGALFALWRTAVHSGAQIVSVGYELADGTPFIGCGIQPDIPCRNSMEDWRIGHDRQLDAALDVLRDRLRGF